MVELFQTFFPDKRYDGVRANSDGTLEFPVHLPTGETHDIDELSSGEKEILYGYLRLKNSTPPHSVILLDEPELHLNPSLLEGFTDFYYRHLGVEQGNQLWLVTHSDNLLRQSVGNFNYRVFQMVPATVADCPENQAVEVLADDDVERATISLVGDLAAYRPHGKVVILEGTGFDVSVVKRLFPDFARRVNLVSGGSKAQVTSTLASLNSLAAQANLKNRFFAVVDRDFENLSSADQSETLFSWDVYHIENYLLDAPAIRSATQSLTGRDFFSSSQEVMSSLERIASTLVDELVLQSVQDDINSRLTLALRVKGNPSSGLSDGTLLKSIEASAERVAEIASSIDAEYLLAAAENRRSQLRTSLHDGTWVSSFPGRPILRRLAAEIGGGVDARMFGNLVLDKLAEASVKPAGMAAVLDAIGTR